jgi:hypothetical protein
LTPEIRQPGYYEVVVTDEVNGCQGAVGLVIFSNQLEPINTDLLRFPNVVSTNQDDLNNVWRVFLYNAPQIPQALIFDQWHLQVFNRWGHRVSEITSPASLWYGDGLDEGVYYYTLSYSLLCGDGDLIHHEGYIHLMR